MPSAGAEKIRAIARHYGKEPQMGVAQEECAELIQAISKIRRKGETVETLDNLVEEIADVSIMCAQLEELFGVRASVALRMHQKLNRQMKRIMEGDTAYDTTDE